MVIFQFIFLHAIHQKKSHILIYKHFFSQIVVFCFGLYNNPDNLHGSNVAGFRSTQINTFLDFSLHQKIKFSTELEVNKSIHFLDLKIAQKNCQFEFEIYRKPTLTDTIILGDSLHPFSQVQAFNSMLHRPVTITVTQESFH